MSCIDTYKEEINLNENEIYILKNIQIIRMIILDDEERLLILKKDKNKIIKMIIINYLLAKFNLVDRLKVTLEDAKNSETQIKRNIERNKKDLQLVLDRLNKKEG